MKKLVQFGAVACIMFGAALAAFAQSTTVRQACQTTYANEVTTCAKGLSFLEPSTRAGAQKACVSSAKMKRSVCLGEGAPDPVCQQSCASAYDMSVAQCQITYNPLDCGNSAICTQIVTQQQSICISDAVTVLNTCTAACPIQ